MRRAFASPAIPIIETNSSAVELMQINVIVFIEQTSVNVFGSGRIGDE